MSACPLMTGVVLLLSMSSTVEASCRDFRDYPSECTPLRAGTSPSTLEGPSQQAYNVYNIPDCWTIEAEKGHLVQLTLLESNLTQCAFLHFFDGQTPLHDPGGSNLLAMINGSLHWNLTVTSTGQYMSIVGAKSERGDWSRAVTDYISIPDQRCIIVDASTEVREIRSPGFDYSYYENDVDLCWIIQAPSSDIVYIQFGNFSLEESPGCKNDRLIVREGGTANSRELMKRCGDAIPEELSVSGGSAFIHLITDAYVTDLGFSLFYSTIPINMINFLKCEYYFPTFGAENIFKASRDQEKVTEMCYIMINKYLDLVPQLDTSLAPALPGPDCNPSVTIQENYEEARFPVTWSACNRFDLPGRLNPGDISLTSGSPARLHFGAAEPIEFYYEVDVKARTWVRYKDLYHSPRPREFTYRRYYGYREGFVPERIISTISDGTATTWMFLDITIVASPGLDRVKLIILDLHLQSEDCDNNSFLIVDGTDKKSGTHMAKYCGAVRMPVTHVTSTGNMYIEFSTQAQWRHTGFTAEYDAIPSSSESLCTHYDASELDISSQVNNRRSSTFDFQLPPKDYTREFFRCWRITTKSDQMVIVFINHLHLLTTDDDEDAGCGESHIQIYHDADAELEGSAVDRGPHITKLCGSRERLSVNSSYSGVVMMLRVMGEVRNVSFTVEYSSDAKGDSGSTFGGIIGYVLFAVIVILVITGFVVFCIRRNRDYSSRDNADSEM